MNEMTREKIEHACALAGAMFCDGNADEAEGHVYCVKMNQIRDLAIQALTARSEGFREGVEAAAKVCEDVMGIGESARHKEACRYCAERIRALQQSPARVAEETATEMKRVYNAMLPDEAPAKEQPGIEFDHGAYKTDRRINRIQRRREDQVKLGRWVSVTERLPGMGQEILKWVGRRKRIEVDLYARPDWFKDQHTTHWMPLPPPPERP